MTERLPDFLVLGAQKGGTTTLQQLLSQHPGIFLPPKKEVHYFSKHWEQPTAWYAAHYVDADPKQRCGDITPYYLFHPEAPKRIHSLLPDAQLIVLLRDPVERALSALRKLRNAFAHSAESASLTDPAHSARLAGIYTEARTNPLWAPLETVLAAQPPSAHGPLEPALRDYILLITILVAFLEATAQQLRPYQPPVVMSFSGVISQEPTD